MKKTAVIYWSGTGNTKQMAEAVLEGMKNAGAEAVLLEPAQVDASTFSGVDAVAFGCPAMGSEVLEEMEFEPMFSACKNSLGGKKVALFGSFGWGDGEWMRTWEKDCDDAGINLACDSITCQETPDDNTLEACHGQAAGGISHGNTPLFFFPYFLSFLNLIFLFPIFLFYLSFFPEILQVSTLVFRRGWGRIGKPRKDATFLHTTAPPGRAALYAFRFRHGSG